MTTCAIEGCGRPRIARGFCEPHYARWRRTGNPLGSGGPVREVIRGDDVRRFWSYVDMDGPTPERHHLGPCWCWQGNRFSNGYGQFLCKGKKALVHRWAYEALVGPIPEGLDIDHLCRNRACVNPGHMEPVTRRVNTLRGVGPAAVNAAKTHCVNGHGLSGRNLIRLSSGKRECRSCRQEYDRRRNKMRRAS